MTRREQLFQGMISDCPTTYLASYRRPEFDTTEKTVYIPVPKIEKPRPLPGLIETLTHLKKNIPFDLFWRLEDNVLRFNPWTEEIRDGKFKKPQDANHDEVIRTRPRLVISPALAIDDITDPKARKIVTDDTYASVWIRESREAVTLHKYVKAPLPTKLYPPRLVKLPDLELEVVSPEWRMHSCSWEDRQVRSEIDKNDVFWRKYVEKKDGLKK